MKSYAEIDLDETPIVVLGCGHFFTAETLDGMFQMSGGEITRLKDVSSALAQQAPRCPDCNSPIRQFVTQRYNRVVNRAVIDEMSKRFLVSGQDGLRKIEEENGKVQQEFEHSREEITQTVLQAQQHRTGRLTAARQVELDQIFKKHQAVASKLEISITHFQKEVADRNQPA
jgi:hypothetical protein